MSFKLKHPHGIIQNKTKQSKTRQSRTYETSDKARKNDEKDASLVLRREGGIMLYNYAIP